MQEQCVHDFNHRQTFRQFFQLALAGLFADRAGSFQLFGFLLDNVAELGLQTFLVLQEQVFNGSGVRQARQDFQAGAFFDEFNRLQIFRIQHRHFQLIIFFAEGDDVVIAGNRFGNRKQSFALNFLFH